MSLDRDDYIQARRVICMTCSESRKTSINVSRTGREKIFGRFSPLSPETNSNKMLGGRKESKPNQHFCEHSL